MANERDLDKIIMDASFLLAIMNLKLNSIKL